jgi:hypothetical protein
MLQSARDAPSATLRFIVHYFTKFRLCPGSGGFPHVPCRSMACLLLNEEIQTRR